MIYLQLIGGAILLLGGGEIMVKGAVTVAARVGVSKLLIGLTVVGFGTSTPELVASVNAAWAGSPGIAIGNVVGSNIANVLLILGITALILPIATHRQAFMRDGPVLFITAILLAAICLTGWITRITGVVFVLLLAAYTTFSYFMDRRTHGASAALHEEQAEHVSAQPTLGKGLLFLLGGLAGVLFGADLLVDGAISVARSMGLSETLIGLTLVAVGTSLPELATAVLAAKRGHGDVAVGNIVGSNIFNTLGIAGVTAIVRPIQVPPEIVRFDIWVMLVATVLLITVSVTGWKIVRWEALLFLVGYIIYIASQFI